MIAAFSSRETQLCRVDPTTLARLGSKPTAGCGALEGVLQPADVVGHRGSASSSCTHQPVLSDAVQLWDLDKSSPLQTATVESLVNDVAP